VGRKRLDLLLVERGFFESRAKARAAIEAGQVSVDGIVASRPAALSHSDAAIEAAPAHPWVGRGALKLEHALQTWPIVVEGRTVLDIGASTGGFTEVCLARGAAKVFAVDVGHGQLHPRLKADPRVVDLEGTDARRFTGLGEPVTLVVCDVSFISLEKALPSVLALAAPGADLIALVKPQFEVGRNKVGRGGVVRREADRAFALQGVKRFLGASGWDVRAAAESPILGGDGNHEWLVWATKPYSTT
jgi:23S rRNA (cytidine1920-2'-O)/16S rRNA (cytidine1409-2'-O)-methyltransferase